MDMSALLRLNSRSGGEGGNALEDTRLFAEIWILQ
jgi:hypothetical protein